MKITFRYSRPVGAAWSDSAMGPLPNSAVVTHQYTAQTEGEREFARACASRGLEWSRDERQDEIDGFTVENVNFKEFLAFIRGMARPALEKSNKVTLER